MMKVITSLTLIYHDKGPLLLKLKDKVDNIFKSIKTERWHYESRVKSLESFAQKMETGRVPDTTKMEDFFACTLVVENSVTMKDALSKIDSAFQIIYRKPKEDTFTHKSTDSFPFDDLRLYAKLKRDNSLPETGFDEQIFEIQLKTFFQHAWTIATHDMMYKSEDISWAKQRIAYQIKAMIEHAELTIEGVDSLCELPALAKDNRITQELQRTYKLITSLWDISDLPSDIIRLAENVNSTLYNLKISLEELEALIKSESEIGKGIHTKNLSPFLIIIQSIVNKMPKNLNDYLKSSIAQKRPLYIPKEIDISNLSKS